ncbi:hypothetical protein CLU79DRAFT_765528 [Phycomyces nitens]|nr:hypothetical protein CLU79DRAFT_765528 [Phycomyces nitens]
MFLYPLSLHSFILLFYAHDQVCSITLFLKRKSHGIFCKRWVHMSSLSLNISKWMLQAQLRQPAVSYNAYKHS